MVDIYDTRVLVGVVATLPRPKTFILDNFFPVISQATEESILFDVVEGKRRLAPFVAPSVAGRVVRSQGYVTQSFRPASGSRTTSASASAKRRNGSIARFGAAAPSPSRPI